MGDSIVFAGGGIGGAKARRRITTFSAFSLDAALLLERHAYWSVAA